MRFVVVTAVIFTCTSVSAQTCRTPEQVLAGLVIPVEGTTDAPRNVAPIVGDRGALELSLIDGNGNVVPSTIESIAVGALQGAQATMRRVIPAGDLDPGANITVVADGAAVTHFNVVDEHDDAIPGAPDASLVGACNSTQGSVAIGVASDDAVLFIGIIDGEPTLGAGARLDGASSSDELVFFGTGSAVVNVAGVDLAGNVGASTPIDVEFPEVALCACTSTSRDIPSGACAIGLASVLVHARRRRR